MQPIILALDTTTEACSVALSNEGNIFVKSHVEPQAHARLILGMIDDICLEADIELSQINAIAFGHGPGSFTGVRIGVSVVQGLAFGLQKQVIGVSSLHALAQQAANLSEHKYIVPLIDARMNEVYWGIYQVQDDGLAKNIVLDGIARPLELVFETTKDYLLIGTGVKEYGKIIQEQNPKIQIDSSILYPKASEILQIALTKYEKGEFTSDDLALPHYIRNNVVQQNKKDLE